MKRVFLFLLTVFFISSAYAQEEKVKGVWYNTEKTSKIKIFKATNGKYYGEIVWMEEPEKKDVENPDESKRDNLILGSTIIKGFTFDVEKNQWEGGTIYDPENGKTYDCYMWFDGSEKNSLNVKGYVMGMKFVGRQVEWTRTEM